MKLGRAATHRSFADDHQPGQRFVSDAVVAECRELLARPELNIRRGLRHQLLQLATSRLHMEMPLRALKVTKDPDNKFLESSDVARAANLVTANARYSPKFWKET
ncbi:MAG: hypothetical protein KIT83_06100 [Bryobacterales bacterium]|nr:hypothetical protein [Bryobacterales bacterium]